MNYFMKHKNKQWAAKVMLTVMLTILLMPILPFGMNSFADSPTVGATVYGSSQLAQIAIQNNKVKFEGGVAFDGGGYDTFGFYDVYILSKEGETVAQWVYEGESLQDRAMELADAILQEPNKKVISPWSGSEVLAYSAKTIAHGYLAMGELGASGKANQLMEVLKDRQASIGDGSFDRDPYSDIPALEALGRAGKLEKINTQQAIDYILKQQHKTSGAWPGTYADFQTTAQAVRSLLYLKGYGADQALVQAAIDKGNVWLKSQQQNDGSFKTEWDDPLIDTAEILYCLQLLDLDLNSWKTGEKGPVDYMIEKALNGDRTFGTGKNIMNNTYALEAYTIIKNSDSTQGYTVSQLATKAAGNNKVLYEKGTPVDGGWTSFNLYDLSILKKAKLDIGTWLYNGKSMKNEGIDLIDTLLAEPNKRVIDSWSGSEVLAYSAKTIAQGYLAMKELGESERANQLLQILKERQESTGDGSFDSNVFSDIPAFEALGRAGSIHQIDTARAADYILSQQERTTGAWTRTYADFQATAQAVRSLIYLKPYVQEKADLQSAIDKGIEWLKLHQEEDGGFKTEWDDPVVNTAEIIYILKALDQDLNAWKKSGKGPVDYMMSKALNEDGTFGITKNIMGNTWALDAYLMMGGLVGNLEDGNNGSTPGGNNPTQEEIKVTVQIIGKSKETLFGPSSVTLHKNDKWAQTAIGALDKTGLSYNASSNFVSSIAGQSNEGLNGWMYMVNGSVPGVQASDYQLRDGDQVTWWYSTNPNEVPGGGPGVTPQNPVDVKEARKADDKKLTDTLEKTGEAKLVLGKDSGGKAYLSLSTIADLSDKHKSLILVKDGIVLEFGQQSLMNERLEKLLTDKDVALEFGIKELTDAEQKDILKKAGIGTEAGLFEIGGKILSLTVQFVYLKENGEIASTEEITTFQEPVKVTVDLSDAKLKEEEFGKLTGVRYEEDKDGRITPIKLGGSYDGAAKKYRFHTDTFSLYGILKAEQLVKIHLQLENNKITVNDEPRELDVPAILVENRTMVPVRFIAETFGAQVEWVKDTKTVTILLADKELSLQVDEMLPGMDVPARMTNGRTLVPLRYVSENLGARVLWIPSEKTIEILQ
ncbi:MAG: stalk domain-containing protein [Thermotaleaceae bacterium]